MKVLILQEFEGYPDGDSKGPTTFKVSHDPVEVSDDFGKLIVGKGHAKVYDGAAAVTAAPALHAAPGEA